MFTAADLLDLHDRTHAGHAKLLAHCAQFSAEELHRELPGFGLATLQLQLHHIIDAEAWWIGVVQGRSEYADSETQYPTVAALEAYRAEVADYTRAYLARATDAELNTAREMAVGEGQIRTLVPAHVFFRVFTHCFHHRGQAAAMCRLLGRPIPPLDYPIIWPPLAQ